MNVWEFIVEVFIITVMTFVMLASIVLIAPYAIVAILFEWIREIINSAKKVKKKE